MPITTHGMVTVDLASYQRESRRIAELEAALWKFAEFGRWFDSLDPETPIILAHVPENKPNDLTAADFTRALDLLLTRNQEPKE